MTLGGLVLTMVLASLRIPGTILIVVILLTISGFFLTRGAEPITQAPTAVVAAPAAIDDLLFALDPRYLWEHFSFAFPVLLSLVFIDLFTSLAAMNAMCQRGGLVDERGTMLNGTRALSADALATIGAGLAGTSTTNCYSESSAGIESGGRTGLVAIGVGVLFLASVFLNPLFMIVPAEATAPALIFLGTLMFSEVRQINFQDGIAAGSATLTLILIGRKHHQRRYCRGPACLRVRHGAARPAARTAPARLPAGRRFLYLLSQCGLAL